MSRCEVLRVLQQEQRKEERNQCKCDGDVGVDALARASRAKSEPLPMEEAEESQGMVGYHTWYHSIKAAIESYFCA